MRANDLSVFYRKVPILSRFSQVFEEANYRPIPSDWHVVVTDVVNSTIAIEKGKYKDVNVSGALPAMALTNYIGHMEFPFVFGGDGMTYLIPPYIKNAAEDILVDTKQLVKNIMGLDLRVGIVPVGYLDELGKKILITRLRVSSRYVQAIIDGDGLEYAETLIKDDRLGSNYLISTDRSLSTRADFTGFTCRWKPIKSPKGETISVIVKPQIIGSSIHSDGMRDIFAHINSIIGDVSEYRPVRQSNQFLGVAKQYLRTEASVLSRRSKGLVYALRLYTIRVTSLFMNIMKFRLNATAANNSVSSDFRKFDGTLKMVVSCSTKQRIALTGYLQSMYEEGKVFYGIHIAQNALLTCLVQKGNNEVHFVDSDNGGYALAAKHLKQQIAERNKIVHTRAEAAAGN